MAVQLHTFDDGDDTITVKTIEIQGGEYLAVVRPHRYGGAIGRGFSTIGAIADLFAKLPAAESEHDERDELAARFDHARDLRKHEAI